VSLDVITAKAGDTADSLARRMQNLTRGTGLFYILNNLFPGDPVVVGEKYKVVVLN
jgi:predicted Zn-dependent protease